MGKATSPRAKGAKVATSKASKAKVISVKLAKLLGEARQAGRTSADGFASGVKVFAAIGANKVEQVLARRDFMIGYIAAYLASRNTRSNKTPEMWEEVAAKIHGDTSTRPEDSENKLAYGSAGNSATRAMQRAGYTAKGEVFGGKAKRKARPATVPANDDGELSDATKTMLDASPGFKSTAELNAYGLKQAVALIGTCNKNAIAASNAFKSACETFAAAMRALAPSE